MYTDKKCENINIQREEWYKIIYCKYKREAQRFMYIQTNNMNLNVHRGECNR
jgi:hypothetical protein